MMNERTTNGKYTCIYSTQREEGASRQHSFVCPRACTTAPLRHGIDLFAEADLHSDGVGDGAHNLDHRAHDLGGLSYRELQTKFALSSKPITFGLLGNSFTVGNGKFNML